VTDANSTQGLLYTDGDTGTLKVRRYVLRVTAGPDAGLERQLESGTVLIGSHENNDIVLKDPTISRYHLELQVRTEGIRVTDQDSTNGTYLGDTRLGSVVVKGRARLRVGGETEVEIAPADEKVDVAPFGQQHFGRVYGAGPAMQALFALLDQVSPTESTVLLSGETGTGKELLAEAIHAASKRAKGPFVIVDCGAIPRELMAAELFGHTRGAFTGATGQKDGLADAASKGTLFLDEIGELPLDLQPQLLRLLEKKEVRPIGETAFHRVDIRVVAATNKDLRALVHKGSFREDLFFRLAVVQVVIPPLRNRREDIPELVRIFLAEIGQSGFGVPEAILQQLLEHDWPGNVRELRNTVERGLSLATSQVSSLEPDYLAMQGGGGAGGGPSVEHHVDAEMMDLPFKEAKGILTEAFEREYLTKLLDKHKGNISRAALEAGIDRNYIHRLVKRYKIPVPRE
jgi:transcriptional regulator with PAS, ATPase and Fis domain